MRSSNAHYIGLTRKSLSKFTGMLQVAWVQTRGVPLKSHWESHRLDPVVLVNEDNHVRALCDRSSAKILINGASFVDIAADHWQCL